MHATLKRLIDGTILWSVASEGGRKLASQQQVFDLLHRSTRGAIVPI